jgi:hypothetical protein
LAACFLNGLIFVPENGGDKSLIGLIFDPEDGGEIS